MTGRAVAVLGPRCVLVGMVAAVFSVGGDGEEEHAAGDGGGLAVRHEVVSRALHSHLAYNCLFGYMAIQIVVLLFVVNVRGRCEAIESPIP
jgi:hypothetical protein